MKSKLSRIKGIIVAITTLVMLLGGGFFFNLFLENPVEAVTLKQPKAETRKVVPNTTTLPAAPEEKEIEIDKRQQARIKQAARSLAHLKTTMRRDDFFSQRVALNVWRCNAEDAGVFDEKRYQELKLKIYHTSIDKILKWFDAYVQQKYYYEANICLNLWRLQAKEIGTFDKKKYRAMRKRLK